MNVVTPLRRITLSGRITGGGFAGHGVTTASLTLFFDVIHANDTSIVGGKGANLGALTRAGVPVPPGFCVTTRA